MIPILGVALALAAAAGAQPTVVTLHPSRPIAEQLPPGSRDVVVKLLSEIHALQPIGPPTFDEALRSSRDFSAAVVVGQISDVKSFEVELPAWIHTRVTLRVSAIPFARRPVPGEVAAVFNGGDLLMNGVRVRTENAVSFVAGGRYLLFLSAPDFNGTDWGMNRFYGILPEDTLVDRNGEPFLDPTGKPMTLERMVAILSRR